MRKRNLNRISLTFFPFLCSIYFKPCQRKTNTRKKAKNRIYFYHRISLFFFIIEMMIMMCVFRLSSFFYIEKVIVQYFVHFGIHSTHTFWDHIRSIQTTISLFLSYVNKLCSECVCLIVA